MEEIEAKRSKKSAILKLRLQNLRVPNMKATGSERTIDLSIYKRMGIDRGIHT